MKTIETDILVIGSGVAGATFACAMLKHPQIQKKSYASIQVIDRAQSPTSFQGMSTQDMSFDSRISSINRGSENSLKSINAWQHLNFDRVFPYQYVQIADKSNADEVILEFDAHQSELKYMGNMLENNHLVSAIHQEIKNNEIHANIRYETHVEHIEYDELRAKWHVTTSHGHYMCRLLVGADGKNSIVRKAASIDVSQGFYHQKCIVGNIYINGDLKNTAWQRFLDTGPIGVLPMSQPLNLAQLEEHDEALQCFSLAWSCEEDVANDLLNLYQQTPEKFTEKLQGLLPSYYGDIVKAENIASYPLWHQSAHNYHSPGMVLIGDAAHSIHPLAGLGANLGIRDAAVLAEELLKITDLEDVSQINAACKAYQSRCQQYNDLILKTMGMFKSAFEKNSVLPISLLTPAIKFGNQLGFVKQTMIEYATGIDKFAPKLS